MPRKRAIRSREPAEGLRVVLGRGTSAGDARAGWSSRGHPARLTRHRVPRSPRRSPRLQVAVASPPVLGQQVVEDVVDGDRAEQVVARRRRPAPRPGCTSRGSWVTVAQRGVRAQRLEVGVDDALTSARRRLAQQPLEVHDAEVLAGRRLRRRPADVDLRGERRGEVGVADPGQRVGDGGVRRQDRSARWSSDRRRCRRRRRAAGARGAASSGSISSSSCSASACGQLGEQVGGVVGVPSPRGRRRRAPPRACRGSRPGRPRAAPPARRRAGRRRARRRPRRGAWRTGRAARWRGRRAQLLEGREQVLGALAAPRRGRSPSTASQSTVSVSPRRRSPSAGAAATKTCVTTQSRVRLLLHRDVDDGRPRLAGLEQRHRAVEQLAEDQRLGRPLLEPAHVDQPGGDDLAGVDRGHPGHRHEDPAPAGHLDDQAEHPRRPARPTRSVTTTSRTRPTWSPFGSKTASAGQARDEDPGRRAAHAGQATGAAARIGAATRRCAASPTARPAAGPATDHERQRPAGRRGGAGRLGGVRAVRQARPGPRRAVRPARSGRPGLPGPARRLRLAVRGVEPLRVQLGDRRCPRLASVGAIVDTVPRKVTTRPPVSLLRTVTSTSAPSASSGAAAPDPATPRAQRRRRTRARRPEPGRHRPAAARASTTCGRPRRQGRGPARRPRSERSITRASHIRRTRRWPMMAP